MGFFKEVFKQIAINTVADALTGSGRRRQEKKVERADSSGFPSFILGLLVISFLGLAFFSTLIQHPQALLVVIVGICFLGILLLLIYVITISITKLQDYLAERRADREYAMKMEANRREKEAQDEALNNHVMEQIKEKEKWYGMLEVRKAYRSLKRVLEEKDRVKELQMADSLVDNLVKIKCMAFEHLDLKSMDQKELVALQADIEKLGKKNDPEYSLLLQKLEEKIVQHDLAMSNFKQIAGKVEAYLVKSRLHIVSGESIGDDDSFVELKRLTALLEQNVKTLDEI